MAVAVQIPATPIQQQEMAVLVVAERLIILLLEARGIRLQRLRHKAVMVERESVHKVLAAAAVHRLLAAQQHLLQLAAMVAQEQPQPLAAAASLTQVVAVDARHLLRQTRRVRAAQEGAVMLPLLVAHQQALLARPTQVAAAVVVETTQLPAPATAAQAVLAS